MLLNVDLSLCKNVNASLRIGENLLLLGLSLSLFELESMICEELESDLFAMWMEVFVLRKVLVKFYCSDHQNIAFVG